MSINRVVLMGRLTKDPVLRTTPSGISTVTFSIAVDRNYVKSGEERTADFFDAVAWRTTADFIASYFSKGDMIAIDGQLQTRKYTAKDGTNRHVVEINVDRASFTGAWTNTQIHPRNNTPVIPSHNAPASNADTLPLDDEDLPFGDEDLPFDQ